MAGDVDATIPLPIEHFTASVNASAQLLAGTSGEIRPPFWIKLKPPTGEIHGKLDFNLIGEPPTPIVVLGEAGKSRLEVGQSNWVWVWISSGTPQLMRPPPSHACRAMSIVAESLSI